MAPEIYRVNKNTGERKLIADVPDQSGVYETPSGKITIDASGVRPGRDRKMVLTGEMLKGREGARTENGRRIILLSERGISNQDIGRGEQLFVKLHYPITHIDLRTGDAIGTTYPDYPNLTGGIQEDLPPALGPERDGIVAKYRKG